MKKNIVFISNVCLFLFFSTSVTARSVTFTPYAITQVIKLSEATTAGKCTVVTEQQKFFLDNFYTNEDKDIISKVFLEQELFGYSSYVCSEVNSFLQHQGFSIALTDRGGFPHFYVAAIQRIMTQWFEQGMEFSLARSEPNGKCTEYEAVLIENRDKRDGVIFDVYKSEGHPNPILCMHTKSGDLVYMTVVQNSQEEKKQTLSDAPADEFELYAKIEQLSEYKKLYKAEGFWDNFKQALFPVVSLRNTGDISWLLHLLFTFSLKKDPAVIEQAFLETHFDMDTTGVKVEVVVALEGAGACEQPKLRIDSPFYLWIERPGLKRPFFYAYLDVDCWKEKIKGSTVSPSPSDIKPSGVDGDFFDFTLFMNE